MAQITRLGVYGVYFKKDKMLLIEQQGGPFKGKYDFPGGGIEFGETPKMALQREFAEEVAMGFDSMELETNLTNVLESFYQIGMIYQVRGVYPLSGEETGELQYFWVDVKDLKQDNCSALLWKWANLPKKKCIDLSHSLDESIPSWDGDCGFESTLESDDEFRTHSISMKAGVGTHLDAPAHCIRDGKTIDELTLDKLIGPCIVIDGETIDSFEKKYGRIPKGSFVIIRTGWGRHWQDREKYQNNYPTISKETAELLLARDIAGLGVDTLSPDSRESDFPVHKILLGAGKLIIENIANSDQLPPVGSTLFALPLKIKSGTEAPLRLIAVINPCYASG